MKPPNVSSVTEFQLLGFQNLLEWQTLLFAIFLFIYFLTVTGNVVIIAVVSQDQRLHSPMYVFLKQLSFLDIWYTSTIVPLLLANLFSHGQAISFPACMAQLYFFVFFGATECFLLAMMAYDQYLAICSPLHYSFLMSPETCTELVAISWLTGVGTGFLPSLMISKLDFCGPNQINHFFCDLPPLMRLSCSSVYITRMVIFILSIAVLCICFLLTLVSYVFIISTILRIPSASGQMKTFSTCGSHLAVVTIYYGTMISMYVHPNDHLSPEINKIISVFYTVVTPLLNPVIYSLRNQEFKEAVRKVMRKKCGIYGVRVKGSFFVRWSQKADIGYLLQFECTMRGDGNQQEAKTGREHLSATFSVKPNRLTLPFQLPPAPAIPPVSCAVYLCACAPNLPRSGRQAPGASTVSAAFAQALPPPVVSQNIEQRTDVVRVVSAHALSPSVREGLPFA
ncbi:PREDICTED: olfactory receptor 11L1 [Odobenus rosmarus divergens]|uniref:Olfactory receptor 11L1 n=1 Tax=Odobenus rosmarus divergens TaxID=9708 RepID=A0A2U3WCK7_ODORO|nr:PREDICTED: olfactory receptor 11L1 [Odobenus rosmarus divergens]